MFNDLAGKRILITGSTIGMGLAAAKLFVQLGAKVGLNGRTHSDAIDQLVAELNQEQGEAAFFAADLTQSAQCQQLVQDFTDHFGGLDILINNAGGLGGRSPLEGIDDAFYDHVMNLNARSALMMTKYAIPFLKQSAQQSGQTSCVISTGSIAAREGGGVGAGIYAASKAWLHDIHRNWVKEFTKDNIRFNIVSPGTIDTAFHDGKSDEVRTAIANSIPMGRFGTSEEVAPSFAFLASHACSGYITGQVLDVNGGQIAP
ncbi:MULTISPECIES: SDR family NAD(P)-dependent oxidoreductase [unclassified Vibrio]|uniref:SDR family NAD(P)-dependent oxidoreductase n=1 Tax=Vibrio sp. HB236076 TaxID=3232307 RepID=A0AB39HDV7_9VIBR|nr:SDR family NAD(P)-dependent oxidoreductase [Vibrio sp. HB161653]MDP5255368.1 SDR family NAD(P)-dependent oxidoreductase [Vibrio sp. HB161653]